MNHRQPPTGTTKRAKYKIALPVLSGLAAFSLCQQPAHAEESGNTQWPSGLETVASALLPPVGATEYYNYLFFYDVNRLSNNEGGKAVPNFSAKVVAEGARLVHTWTSLGHGWELASQASMVLNYVHVNATFGSGNAAGINYIYMSPAYFAYNNASWHVLLGPSVIIPVGSFSTQKLVNPSNGYYSFNQEIDVTYMPSPVLEASIATSTTVNATNPVSHYHSGAIFDTDFDVNYSFIKSIPNLQFGINGFYTQQFTDDTVDSQPVDGNGFRLKKFAIGPQIVYYISPSIGVALKWQHEIVSHNAPKGDGVWFEFVLPVG